MILPNPPAASLFRRDPERWAAELEQWGREIVGLTQDDSRDLHTPARAQITITNGSPVYSLSGTTTAIADVRDFLIGLCTTMIAKGLLRTKTDATGAG